MVSSCTSCECPLWRFCAFLWYTVVVELLSVQFTKASGSIHFKHHAETSIGWSVLHRIVQASEPGLPLRWYGCLTRKE
jgi:hypothetical protein